MIHSIQERFVRKHLLSISKKFLRYVFHLLNDLRNLDYSCFLLTNLELNLENFQFYNVNIIKTETTFYHDFLRYELILNIFEHTNDSEIYYLDCDSRFFDFDKNDWNISIRDNSDFIVGIERFNSDTSRRYDALSSFT